MKRSNKKGFTIVELVIVIAVIAILAAVLIPTIAGIVRKANIASDTAVAKNMNTALADYSAKNGTPDDFDEVLAAIEEYGYVLANLNAKADGNIYGWDTKNNQIVYIDANGETIYSNTKFDKANVKFIVNGNAPALEGFAAPVDMSKPEGPKAFKAALEDGISVTLKNDMTITSTVNVSSDVTVNLNGKKLDASANTSRPFKTYEGANITINATGSKIECGRYGLVDINEGGNVVITGGEFTANTDNGSFVKLRAGDSSITLNDVKYVDSSNNGYVVNMAGYKDNVNVNVNGGSYTAARGFQLVTAEAAKFEGVTINTTGVAINANSDVEVKDCTITVGNGLHDASEGDEPVAAVAISTGKTATITGCTITGSYAYRVYPTGGVIVATNNNVENVENEWYVHDLYEGKTATVTINGTVVNK